MRIKRLPRAVLRFKGGTAPTPYEGFKAGFKPVRGPSKIKVGVLFEEDAKRPVGEFCENLEMGVKGFGGLGEWFNVEVEWVWQPVGERGFEEAAGGMPDVDLALALIPDAMMVDYEDDPYMPLKRALSARGIPSQMVERSTLENLRGSSYVLFNIALSIYAKTGGVPWTLDDPLTYNLCIGLDTARPHHRTVASCCVHGSGEHFTLDWNAAEPPQGRLEDAATQAIAEATESYIQTHRSPPASLTIHVEATSPILELNFNQLLQKLAEKGLLEENVKYTVASINMSGPPRIYAETNGKYFMPDKGTYTILDYERGIVCTSGYPEHPELSPLGTVKPIMVEVTHSNHEHNITNIIKDIYWLSETHWASGFRTPRLPVTTLYPNRITTFIKAGVKPTPLKGKTWFL